MATLPARFALLCRAMGDGVMLLGGVTRRRVTPAGSV